MNKIIITMVTITMAMITILIIGTITIAIMKGLKESNSLAIVNNKIGAGKKITTIAIKNATVASTTKKILIVAENKNKIATKKNATTAIVSGADLKISLNVANKTGFIPVFIFKTITKNGQQPVFVVLSSRNLFRVYYRNHRKLKLKVTIKLTSKGQCS